MGLFGNKQKEKALQEKKLELERQERSFHEKQKLLTQRENALIEFSNELATQRKELFLDLDQVRQRNLAEIHNARKNLAEDIERMVSQRMLEAASRATKKPYLNGTLIFRDFYEAFQGNLPGHAKLWSALSERMTIEYPLSAHARIQSSSGATYSVSLTSCTCPDFQNRHQPCKHMYRLALELGLLLHYNEPKLAEVRSLLKSVRDEQDLLAQSKEQLRLSQLAFEHSRSEFEAFKGERFQTAPHLAALWAEHEDLKLKRTEDKIRYKAHSAPKAADQIKAIRAEHRTVVEENRLLRHQLDFLRANLPWLEDYMELTVDEVQAAAAAIENESEYASEYESLHRWLSQEEYLRLSDAQRYQLALNRYTARSRSNWEAGIDYERYIGYLFEKEGLHVNYSGATTGKEDMGRDLIVRRGKQIKIVQCKRYSREKQIHENTVFQLYGSCVQYQLEHPGAKVTGAIYTTTLLSDVARACAQAMGIEVHEGFPLQNYPLVKCNIGADGVKRFHLPFSQMYDRLHISPAKGDFYAATVQEAMDAGFVKAKRWTGNNP